MQKSLGSTVFKLYGLVVLLIILKSLSDAFIVQYPSAQMWNDDIVRLVQVRNFLSGQGWYDMTQYRLGLEGGTVLHWSRLIDVPIAGLIVFFDLFLSTENAELAASVVWPLFLLSIAVWLLTRISITIGKTETAVACLYLGTVAIYSSGKFSVGSLDHHNVQIVFMLACLAAALSPQTMLARLAAALSPQTKYTAGIVGGVCAALSLVVGLEAIAYVALFCIAAALRWWWYGAERKTVTAAFSAAFCMTLGLSYLIFWPSTENTAFRCDAFDYQLLLLGCFGSAGLFITVSITSSQTKTIRLIGLIGLGAVTLAFGKFFAPACMSNPLSQIHPDVQTYWLDRINEAKPLLTWLKDPENRTNLDQLVLPIIAVISLIFSIRISEHKEQKLLLALLIAISFAISFYQVRASAFTSVFMVPALALLLSDSYHWYKSSKDTKLGILFIFLMVALNSIFWRELITTFMPDTESTVEIANTTENEIEEEKICLTSDLYEQLNELETGLIVAGTNLAPYILKDTKHSVLASNFHRNQDGIQALIDFSRADVEEARTYLYDWNAKYVILCDGVGDTFVRSLFADKEDTIWPLIISGTPPRYLVQVGDKGGILKIFQVVKLQGS